MTRLRALYERCALAFSASLAIYALVEWLRGMQPGLSWLGLELAAGAPAFYLALRWIRPAAMTPQLRVIVGALCGLGLAITMAVNWRFGESSGIVHIWAGACLLAWAVYVRWARSDAD